MKGKQGEYHDALFNKNNTVSRSCSWVVDSHHPPPRKISRLTRSKTPRRRRASPGDWCDLHTNRHPARLGPAAHASGRGGPFAFARLPGSERGRSRLLFILRRWPRACCPAADERLGFRVTHWRPTPAGGPHRAVVIARVGSLGCAFSALPSRAIHCPLRLLIDDEPSNKKAAEGRTGPRRRRHRRGREPHDEDEGKRGHRQRSHARRTPHSASVCVADRQTWQVACQEAVKKGLLSAAQQRTRRRPLTLTVHNVTTARDLAPLRKGETRP